MSEPSNTGKIRPRGSFLPGPGRDPRINRKGRPRSFDALRALAQQIAHEVALSDGEPVVIGGHKVTVAEDILRQWAQSSDPRKQQAFIEYAYGKVKDEANVTIAGGALTFREVIVERSAPEASSNEPLEG